MSARGVVRLTLTRAEGYALMRAASETMDHGDVLEQTFAHWATRAAARRAYARLRDAWSRAECEALGLARLRAARRFGFAIGSRGRS